MKSIFAALLLSVFAFQSPVSAQGELALEGYFFSFKSCYGRAYSGEHLNIHPDQQVLEIAISHFPEKQELLGLDNPYQSYPDTPRLVLRLDAWLRGKDKGWQEHAICDQDGAGLKCAIECDGGSFTLQGREKAQILMSLEQDLYFTQCDAGENVLKKTREDTSFLLYPLPASHCSQD